MHPIFFTMNYYTSIRNQYCPNPSCGLYKSTLTGNVIVHSQNSKRMRCKSCQKTWAAYRDEIRYGLRSNPQKIGIALEMLKAGISIRKIASNISISPSTVISWKKSLKNKKSIFLDTKKKIYLLYF